MSKKEKVIFVISILAFCLFAYFYRILSDASCYPLKEILILSVIFSLLLILLNKITLNFCNIVKFAMILSFVFLLITTVNLLHLFALRFSSVFITPNYNKANEVQKFIANKYHVYTYLQAVDKNLYTITIMHTKNSNVLDEIAVEMVQSDIWDDTFNVGSIVYEPSNNKNIAKKRIEKALNKRLKLIKGVKSVDVQVNLYEENGKPNSNLTEITANLSLDENSDEQLILNMVKRLLPAKEDNKVVNIITAN